MACISTRTTGRTWPNTRRPSRAANNSLDCHCMKKERSDENLLDGVPACIDWKRGPRRCPLWVVAALSRSEADGGFGNQKGKFHRAGFYGQLDGPTPCIDRSAAGSGADSSAAVAEYRCENRQGRTEISRTRDSHYRQCSRRRKATGLRPGAILRL